MQRKPTVLFALICAFLFVVVMCSENEMNEEPFTVESIDLPKELEGIENRLTERLNQTESRLLSYINSKTPPTEKGRSNSLEISQRTEESVSGSKSIMINIGVRDWVGERIGKRPRLKGEIRLEDGSPSPFQVEFWATALMDGKEVGNNLVRIPVRNGIGMIDATLFPSEYPNQFSGEYDIKISDVIIMEIPDYVINIPKSEESIKNERSGQSR